MRHARIVSVEYRCDDVVTICKFSGAFSCESDEFRNSGLAGLASHASTWRCTRFLPYLTKESPPSSFLFEFVFDLDNQQRHLFYFLRARSGRFVAMVFY